MKKTLAGFAVAVFFAFSPLALRAQQNPVTSAVLSAVKTHGKNLIAGGEEMPADKFNYAPTPQQMTFGHLMLHIAQSNGFFCSQISGERAPSTSGLTEHSPKPRLIAAMKASFNFCEQSLTKVNDSELSGQVNFFGGRKVSRAMAMIALSNDLADHYAQEAIYLRLNGHLPPTAMHHRMGMKRHGGKM